jgi:WD40 repeat protein
MAELIQPPPEARNLPSPPTDATSSLSYLLPDDQSSSSRLLASSSWDGSVRVHDTTTMTTALNSGGTTGELKLVHCMETGPLLSLAVESKTLYTGSLEGSVQMLDIESKTPQLVGRHQAGAGAAARGGTRSGSSGNACSCLVALPSSQPLLASASWNRKFHLCDVRQGSGGSSSFGGGGGKPAATVDLPGKAFAMDVDTSHSRVVVACSGRRTCLIDIRRIAAGGGGAAAGADYSWDAEMVLNAESSQKHQTRCVRFFADGNAISVGSVEGRVSVESTTERDVSTMKKIYAFKCHREGTSLRLLPDMVLWLSYTRVLLFFLTQATATHCIILCLICLIFIST